MTNTISSQHIDQLEQEALKNTTICKQYSFSTSGEILHILYSNDLKKDIKTKKVWLRVKAGQTYRTVETRLLEHFGASSTSAPILLDSDVSTESTDLKLDDKIRAILENNMEFMDFKECDDIVHVDGHQRKHEWIYVNVYEELKTAGIIKNNKYDKAKFLKMFENRLFVEHLSKKLTNAKRKALKILDYKPFVDFVAHPWQEDAITRLITDAKKQALLSICPRGGKTPTTLMYVRELVQSGILKNVMLVPTSRDLASNESFLEDFGDGGFDRFFQLSDCSLFKKSDDVIKNLENEIIEKFGSVDNVTLIMVTDEADRGSHTILSTKKIAEIDAKFGMYQHIVMSGTGIAIASKIFKDISEGEITYYSLNYTELLAYGSDKVVRRNLYNICYNIHDIAKAAAESVKLNGGDETDIEDSKPLNFLQSFKAEYTYDTLSKYIGSFMSKNIAKNENRSIMGLGLPDEFANMVFIPSSLTNEHMKNFVKHFKNMYGDIFEVMDISGNETTNRTAQEVVKNKITKMVKTSDTRQLVLFSKGMASRSFTVPEIRKVLIFSDNELSNQAYQSLCRCLSYDKFLKGVQTGNIIQTTMNSSLSLGTEVFMNEFDPSGSEDSTVRTQASLFLSNNSIFEYVFNDKNSRLTPTLTTSSGIDNGVFVDKVTSFSDRSYYLAVKWYGENINCKGYKLSSTKQNSKLVDDKVKNLGKDKKQKDTSPEVDDKQENDIKALKAYAETVRNIPYSLLALEQEDGFEVTMTNILGLSVDEWNEYLPVVDKDEFVTNLEQPAFKTSFESILNAYNQADLDTKKERLLEFMTIKEY